MTFNLNLNARSNKLSLMQTTLADSFVFTPSITLKCAIEEDSNLAMDWLWYAEQVISENERAYCLQKALFIDPKSDLARQKLAEMRRVSTSKTKRSNAMLLKPARLLQSLVR
jgi:hypothetical protein